MAVDGTGKRGFGIHYAWVVMVAMGLVACGSIGSITVLSGLFFFPVSTELGCDFSTFTLYMSITVFALALAMPLVGSLLTKVRLRTILVCSGILEVGALVGMSFFTEVWMWYVAGAISGIGLAGTSTITITATMGNWFHRKTGLAIGLIWATQSLFVAIASPILSDAIVMYGWRAGYLMLAAVSAVLIFPGSVFVIRYRPEDKGLLPYGFDPDSAGGEELVTGVSAPVAFRSLPFYLCVAIVILCQLTACMNQTFPTYAEVTGLGTLVGGLMVTAASTCDIFFSPLVGMTSDRLGATKSMVVWTVVTMVSFVVLFFGSSSPVASCFGAGINDAMFAICGAGYSTFALSLFGMRDFERIFSRMASIGCLVASFGLPLMMYIYESTGVFQNAFLFCLVVDVVIVALVLAAARSAKSLEHEEEGSGTAE